MSKSKSKGTSLTRRLNNQGVLSKKLTQILLYTVVILLFVVAFFPFYLTIVNSFKHQMQIFNMPWLPERPFRLDNYYDAFFRVIFPIFNSIIITMISVSITITATVFASYSFSRADFPFHRVLYVSVIALMMVPGFALLVPQFVMFNSLGLSNTYLGQALPPAVNSIALGVMLMTAFFKNIPRSLTEAAALDGAGDLRVLIRIIIPLSTPIIAAVAIMSSLTVWNNYIWPLVMTRGESVRPVILAITFLSGDVSQGDGLRLAGYVIASLPIIILFFFATKPFITGITAGAVKG